MARPQRYGDAAFIAALAKAPTGRGQIAAVARHVGCSEPTALTRCKALPGYTSRTVTVLERQHVPEGSPFAGADVKCRRTYRVFQPEIVK